jgi:hypothetical protein
MKDDTERVRARPTAAQYIAMVNTLRTQHATPDWSSPEVLIYRLTAANIGVLMAALAVATVHAIERERGPRPRPIPSDDEGGA